VPAWPHRVDDERGEALHPPVDSDVVDLDAAISQELFDIAVREPEAEMPSAPPAESRRAGTGIERTRDTQDGDDESPGHVRTRTRPINATVPSPTVGTYWEVDPPGD
jgi:hypothetical protein